MELTRNFTLQELIKSDTAIRKGINNNPNAEQIEEIKDPKTKYCEKTYLEAMRRRAFTKREIKVCKAIFIRKIKAEIEYKRKVMQERNIYN